MNIFTTISKQRRQRTDDDYQTYINLLASLDTTDEQQAATLGELIERLGITPEQAEQDHTQVQRLLFLVDATSTKNVKAAKAARVKAHQQMLDLHAKGQVEIKSWQQQMHDSKMQHSTALTKSLNTDKMIGELQKFDSKIKAAMGLD